MGVWPGPLHLQKWFFIPPRKVLGPGVKTFSSRKIGEHNEFVGMEDILHPLPLQHTLC